MGTSMQKQYLDHTYFDQHQIMVFTTASVLSLLLVALCSFIYRTFSNGSQSRRKLPPGPYSLPIIGNLHMLGNLPHRNLQTLSKKYGPIMMIRLGLVPTIVVSSPQAAELFLKTHDTIFASRPKVQSSEYMSYGTKGMAFTEFGPYWKNVRKLCTLELLTPAKINSFAAMRKDEVESVVESLKKSAAENEIVDVSTIVNEVIEDMTCRMLFGKCRDDDLKGTIQEALVLAGAFNVADLVPWLAPFDLQGLKRRMKKVGDRFDKILETIICKHEQHPIGSENHCHDFTDMMLSLMTNSKNIFFEESYTIDRSNVKAIILDMIVASMDTTATVIQWTLLELSRHSKIMKKMQAELESVVGLNKTVQEMDLTKLMYLDMVIKESLRLHPVAPLLLPHESMEDITINGYYIPKKSRILVNTFAIGRDPDVWSDNAEEFYPERFKNNNMDLRGRDFQLLPFGSGRRGCPGIQLGLTMARYVLAQLVHCFDWEASNELDLTEKFGLALHPANNLFAIPKYRLLG